MRIIKNLYTNKLAVLMDVVLLVGTVLWIRKIAKK